jgi:hypothetical protein
MRELLACCHTHLDDADKIISGQFLIYHAIFPEAYKLKEERQWNGTRSTVCLETLEHRTTLHLLLRQTKALTSGTDHVHDKQKSRLHRNVTRLPTRVAPFEGYPSKKRLTSRRESLPDAVQQSGSGNPSWYAANPASLIVYIKF